MKLKKFYEFKKIKKIKIFQNKVYTIKIVKLKKYFFLNEYKIFKCIKNKTNKNR